ncbi:MAG: hypothetical protein R3B41_01945 [Candidatus Doudnabacteria bacterium]
MSDLELTKTEIIRKLTMLCAHCSSGVNHRCSVQKITQEIKSFSGIPLIVNNEFRGVLAQHA